LAGATGLEREEFSIALLCREMKWTWDEYQEQPTWFIDILIGLFNAEAKAKNKENG
jgi:hypothetical protein